MILRRKVLFLLLFLVFSCSQRDIYAIYDINLIGSLNSSNSLSWHTTSFVDCLYRDSRLKFFNTRGSYPSSSAWYYQKLINKSLNLSSIADVMHYSINQNFLSGITIYTDSCWKNQKAGNH